MALASSGAAGGDGKELGKAAAAAGAQLGFRGDRERERSGRRRGGVRGPP